MHNRWKLLHSLRVRLLLTTLVVLAVSTVVATRFASTTIQREFEGYLTNEEEVRLASFESAEQLAIAMLQTTYSSVSGWTNTIDDNLSHISTLVNYPMALLDRDGQVIASTLPPEIPMPLIDTMRAQSMRITVDGRTVGALYMPPLFKPVDNLNSQAFVTSFNQAVFFALFIASVVASLLILLAANPVINTVEDLTEAVTAVAKGQHAQKVEIRSKGEIGQLALAFNRMTDALNHAETLQHNMVGDIAHEVRSPLSNMRAYVEAMRDGVLDADQKTLNTVYDQIMALNNTVEKLQVLTLLDTGKLHFDRQPINPTMLVEDAINRAQPTRPNLLIQNDTSPGLPAFDADPRYVRYILTSLLDNALRYTDEDGSVCISARCSATHIIFKVTDTGIGMTEEELTRAFDRFYRADPSRTRATGGTGIGLTLAKALVEAQKGWIRAESAFGQGSTFTVALPLTL